MRVRLKLPESERKRKDSSVRRAAKRGRLTPMTRIRGPIRTHPSGLMRAARRPPHVPLDPQAKSGELKVIRQPTWGMSAEFCKFSEVLGDGGEFKFVLHAAWPSKPEPS